MNIVIRRERGLTGGLQCKMLESSFTDFTRQYIFDLILAFAFGLQDVRQQGEFLDQLLEPVDGFLLLDLHNLYCQMHNFQISAPEILDLYPLEKVRELHLSGGSWSQQGTETIRRDTHDQAVPEVVFDLLELALQNCSQVQSVILERMGNTLTADSEKIRFRQDFARIKQIVDQFAQPLETNL